MIDISVIIVSYNTKELTLQCIKSVFSEGSGLSIEVIVVDNGSKDGSIKALRNFKKTITLIENSDNLGFAKANNQAISIAYGQYKLLLNSDTLVKKKTIGMLLDYARRKNDIGVVVPKLLNPDGSIQPSVFRFPTLSKAIKQYWLAIDRPLDKYIPQVSEPCEVEAVVMAAFLITPQAIDKVGLLDERYFIFYEDIDYCRRVWQAGLKIYYLPSADVIHYHGASGTNLGDDKNQWRRLIPSSKIYHGVLGHFIFNFVLWSGQKWQRLLGKN